MIKQSIYVKQIFSDGTVSTVGPVFVSVSDGKPTPTVLSVSIEDWVEPVEEENAVNN